MPISSVIKFEGRPDDLVWKSPIEDFNTTSHLVVDETHEALLVVNGQAADLFGSGSHTLSVPNIPILRSIINIPTGGETPFPCKVFYVNKVHQMDMLWGTQGAIALEDPLYDIFMHVMLHGSISLSVEDSRKFLIKLVGFRSSFDADTLVAKFRGIISSHVKNAISKIMINGKLSYFMMNSELFEISEVIKERLDHIFADYGVVVEFFNIETIEVPDKDYAAIAEAKEKRASRLIQGYTWREEREMMIAEKFASNQGAMGAMAGMAGGAMGGMVMGGTIAEIARNALGMGGGAAQGVVPPGSQNPSPMTMNAYTQNSNIRDILNNGGHAAPMQQAPVQQTPVQQAQPQQAPVQQTQPQQTPVQQTQPQQTPVQQAQPQQTPVQQTPVQQTQPQQTPIQQAPASGSRFCPECGAPASSNARFCSQCGHQFAKVCPGCGAPVESNARFCSQCGTPL